MSDYNVVPAVDDGHNFPPEIREALAGASEFSVYYLAQSDLPGQVAVIIAGQPVVTNAASAAVAQAATAQGLVTTTDQRLPQVKTGDIAFTIVDTAGRRSWVEVGSNGRPTSSSLAILSADLGPSTAAAISTAVSALSIPIPVSAPMMANTFAIVDTNGRRSWIEVGPDGAPTPESVTSIKQALGWSNALSGIPQPIPAQQTAVFAITDNTGRRSWLEIANDGGPTQQTMNVLQARLVIPTGVPTQFKSSYGTESAHTIVSGPNVTLSGHSMLAQATSAIASALSGVSVSSISVGGETSRTIAGRQGGQPIMFTPNLGQIPASGSCDIALSFADKPVLDAGWPLLQGPASYIGNLKIGNVLIPGTFSITRDPNATPLIHSSLDTYQFTRTTVGSAISLSRPTPFYHTVGENSRSDIMVYWAGRNNLSELSQVIGDITAMIQRQGGLDKRFLVLSDLNSTTETNTPPTTNGTAITALNNAYRYAWGRRFIDLRYYLLTYGLADLGLTPTSQDNTDIAAGTVPTQLRNTGDTLHLSPAANTLVAALILQRLQEFGWY